MAKYAHWHVIVYIVGVFRSGISNRRMASVVAILKVSVRRFSMMVNHYVHQESGSCFQSCILERFWKELRRIE